MNIAQNIVPLTIVQTLIRYIPAGGQYFNIFKLNQLVPRCKVSQIDISTDHGHLIHRRKGRRVYEDGLLSAVGNDSAL